VNSKPPTCLPTTPKSLPTASQRLPTTLCVPTPHTPRWLELPTGRWKGGLAVPTLGSFSFRLPRVGCHAVISGLHIRVSSFNSSDINTL
jgi:hypothetical protein